MNKNQMKDAFDNLARRGVGEDINLWPSIATQVDRKTLRQTFRTRPVFVIFMVVVTLLLISGVAYAIEKATGYIPGIGLVEESTALRVLAEPVIVTRAGITLTVEQVVLSADKTVVVYKVEGIPADAYLGEGDEEGNSSYSSSVIMPLEGTPDAPYTSTENNDICFADDRLLLPDGTLLPLQTGEGSGWSSGFENRYVFGPVPREIDEATFLKSCIPETVPGKLPENWELPLRFVSAPPDMTILPVVDLVTPAINESQSAMTIEQVIETDNGYILLGNFRSLDLPMNAKAQGLSDWVHITDVNGQTVNAAPFDNIDPRNVFGEFPWGYEIEGKQHAWPLTLTIDSVSAVFYQQNSEFEFDTGPNPQAGQKWILNQDITLEGYTIRVVSIERTRNGYAFIFKADPDVTGITPNIKGFPFTSGGGGNDGFGRGDLYFNIEYAERPPSGKLTIELGWLNADIHGPWQVQWSPENISVTP